ncbi:TOBE domain-containing protein [Phormidium sp. FACHB-1136]|uniref:TOBE domain-containing protein n=1 Tax=Phormidium sp. FACHB-1136 TaxID=2692848 RepID=UPI0016848FA6|nr:TOBE domain-containing protein [Phormidium sp. FACHB-1136]MBD2427381.1 TOBE domain-containing protein [Phormidium sp. FACHB-1136]
MKVSARNNLKGTIKSLTMGTVNTEVVVEVAPGVEVVSMITKASAEAMELAEGKEIYAMVKASNIMLAVD